MFRFFTQTKLIVLFYLIVTLVIVQGVYEWLSLKHLEKSMPVNILERNISLSRVVFSLNQLEAVLAQFEQDTSDSSRDQLINALGFAADSLQSYHDSETQVFDSHLQDDHERIMVVFKTMREAIRANTIFEAAVIQSLHARYRKAMVPFPQDYFKQSENAFSSLVQQTARITQFRQFALAISALLVLSLMIVAYMGLSRQKTLQLLRREQSERYRSEALLSAVINNAPYVIYLKDLAGKYLLCNPAFSELYGISQSDCVGRSAFDINKPEQAAEHEEMERSCQECDLPISYEYEFGEDEETRSTYSIIKFPIKDKRGILIGTGGIDIDITQRKSAVQQLFNQKAVMESILNHVPVGVYLKDLAGRYILCNRSFCDWHGVKASELKGKTARDFFSANKAQFFEKKDNACRQSLSVIEHESDIELDDGSLVTEHTIRFPVLDDNGHLLGTGGIDIDISERKQAEQEIEESRNRFQALADNLPEFITLKDTQGRFLFVNRRFEEWTGLSRKDTFSKSVFDIYPPEQAERFNQLDNQVISSGEIYKHEIDLDYLDGRSRTVISTRFPVFSEAGDVLGMGTINHDISERKQAEIALRIAKEQAESADQLKSAFLATMSHELRTPLNSIIGFSGILLNGLAGDLNEEQAKQLGMVKKSASHLLSLINDILDISKIEAGSMESNNLVFELQPAINNSVNLVTPAADKKSLQIEVKPAGRSIEICSDQRRVEQIILNLLSNAIKFSETGVIHVETRRSDNGIEIAISDSGIGICEDDLPHLFQPFYQLDQSGPARKHEGTGLGLALSRKLARILGGDIRVQSCWGEGSVFTLELPLDQ